MDGAPLLGSGIIVAMVALAVGAALTISTVSSAPFIPSERERAELEAARLYCLGPCREKDGTCPLERAGLGLRYCPLWRSLEERLDVTVPWGAIA